jgi:hypothetical protein
MGMPANKGSDCWTDGTFEIEDAPNPLGVLQEHSKTVLALATTFLGASAAFAEKFVGSNPSKWQIGATVIVWAMLLVSIFAAVMCCAKMYGYLSWDRDWKKAQNVSVFWGNVAPWPLFIAGLIVAVLAWYQLARVEKRDAADAVAVCQNFLENERTLKTI